jgi:hypothetical protein
MGNRAKNNRIDKIIANLHPFRTLEFQTVASANASENNSIYLFHMLIFFKQLTNYHLSGLFSLCAGSH